jgi:hypothetical protein
MPVGLFLHEDLDHLQEIQGVIFEVRVIDDRQFRACALEGGLNGSGLTLAGLVVYKDPIQLAVGAGGFDGFKITKNRVGPIRGSIVHHDHLDTLKERRVYEQFKALEACADQILLVIDGNKNRKRDGSHHG